VDPQRLRRGDGAAILELLVVFLAIMVPLVYSIAIMADVQRAMLATSSAAREVGRVYVTAATHADAQLRAQLAYQDTLANYRYAPNDPRAHLRLQSSCPADAPPACTGGFGPAAEIEVVVTYQVPIGRIPFVGVVAGPNLTVGSSHHTRVDRFRGLG
jgi:hypothetical protein